MLVTVAPNVVVNTDLIETVHTIVGTDQYKDEHVIINFMDSSYEFSPSYTMGEISAALNGGCYYRTQWTDEVGDIDVCVLHNQNSQHAPDKGPYRRCLKMSPYWVNPVENPPTVVSYDPPNFDNWWKRFAQKFS